MRNAWRTGEAPSTGGAPQKKKQPSEVSAKDCGGKVVRRRVRWEGGGVYVRVRARTWACVGVRGVRGRVWPRVGGRGQKGGRGTGCRMARRESGWENGSAGEGGQVDRWVAVLGETEERREGGSAGEEGA
eukprot:3174474-Pleurochrysis_carterae.AAC.1